MNCWSVPSAIDGALGVTAIDTSSAAVTVRLAEPAIDVAGSVAVIVVEPCAVLLARPSLLLALLIVATDVDDDDHVTDVVRFCVVLSV